MTVLEQAYSGKSLNVLGEQHREEIANFMCHSSAVRELERTGADPMWLSCAL